MGDFREVQNQAHPNKTNTLMGGVIALLIGILGIQVWLLYSALNNALEDHRGIAIAAFLGSSVLFVLALWLLRYVPQARNYGQKHKKKPENQYS
ncbi:MAG: hypothetical protein QY309_07785 [Cyclobacteriaceae bacterium]|nr:MAG: hypothetical protein QY309_07785 [Cyclobacteriaceae bacterium]